MNRTFLFVTLMLLSSLVFGQARVGLRGGLHLTSLPTKTYETDDYTIESLDDSYSGFHLGIMSQIKIRNFFIQPELLFVQTGNEMRIKNIGQDVEDVFFTQKYSKIDLPVMMGMKYGPLRLGMGPVASFVLDSSSDINKNAGFEDFKEKFNDAVFGYQIGFGLDLSNLILDFKYEGSLSRFGDGVTIGGKPYSFDTRPRTFILSIGLLF